MFNTIIGPGAVGAGAVAASLYGSGSGSDQMMQFLAARLRLRNTVANGVALKSPATDSTKMQTGREDLAIYSSVGISI
jgi:hypothetical protein